MADLSAEEDPLLGVGSDARRRGGGRADPDGLQPGGPRINDDSDDAADDAQVTASVSRDFYVDVCLLCVLAVFLVVFFSWTLMVVSTRIPQIRKHEVTTSVKMRYVEELEFPAITICNLARDVPLTKLWCGTYQSSQNCTSYIPQGLPHCLAFNNDLQADAKKADRTGLADTLMIALKINVDSYPDTVKFSGVHINLHPRCSHKKGECPQELASSLMAAPGRPRFYRMKKIQFKFLNGTREASFEARDSDTGDINFEKLFGPRHDTVVLGFHYSTMAETLISEVPHYSYLSLGSEIGGIMGLLFGFGLVSVVTSIIRFFVHRGDLYQEVLGRSWTDFVRGWRVVTRRKKRG